MKTEPKTHTRLSRSALVFVETEFQIVMAFDAGLIHNRLIARFATQPVLDKIQRRGARPDQAASNA